MNTTAHIHIQGDRSVGIPSGLATVQFDNDMLDGFPREELRAVLSEFFTNLFDFKASTRFQDECEDCGQRSLVISQIEGKRIVVCANKTCISNRPE